MRYGRADDVDTICDAAKSGIKILVTAHGNNIDDVPDKLLTKKIFDNIIFLKNERMPGKIKNIFTLKEDKYVANT